MLAGLLQAPFALCPDQALRQGARADGAGGPVDGRRGYLTQAEADALPDPRARRAHAGRQPADRHLFRRLGPAAGARRDGGELFAPDAHHHARFAAAERLPPRRRSARRWAGRRSRWWRCAAMARWWRWSADATTQVALQPRHAGAPPAGIDLQDCSSISPRWKPGGSRMTHRQHRDHQGSYRPQECARQLFRPDHAGRCLRPVEQRRGGAAAAGGGQRQGDRMARASASPRRWPRRSQPGARHLDHDADGADRRLCRDRRQQNIPVEPHAFPAVSRAGGTG
jgi:hypothetical protein